jgi:hypothetical protein
VVSVAGGGGSGALLLVPEPVLALDAVLGGVGQAAYELHDYLEYSPLLHSALLPVRAHCLCVIPGKSALSMVILPTASHGMLWLSVQLEQSSQWFVYHYCYVVFSVCMRFPSICSLTPPST